MLGYYKNGKVFVLEGKEEGGIFSNKTWVYNSADDLNAIPEDPYCC
jgi:hypothetical protein